jgi:hypothetical protein
MNETLYSGMSINELIETFRNTCLEQYDTYITDDRDVYNNNYNIQTEITNELRSRGPDARRSLLALLTHENPQVRLQAAKCVYPAAREEARMCLQALAAAGLPDQSLDAGMTLGRLEEVPDCLDY